MKPPSTDAPRNVIKIGDTSTAAEADRLSPFHQQKKPSVNIAVSIIEDDEAVRQILTGWIDTAEGFHCLSTFGSPDKALASLPSAAPDILLVDINLPQMNGIECVRRLKPLIPETQFLMLTVYADTDHIFNALAAGASGYLLKETGQKELIASLILTHEGGAAMTSQIARNLVQSFRPQPEKPEPNGLTPREQAILKLLSHGDYYKEIADGLGISVHTVCTHIRHIYEKLHVRSRAHAIAKYTHASAAGAMAEPAGKLKS
jgi:DNA-binding NarL/FixJ family response regulator